MNVLRLVARQRHSHHQVGRYRSAGDGHWITLTRLSAVGGPHELAIDDQEESPNLC
jgi:hypothetical protein